MIPKRVSLPFPPQAETTDAIMRSAASDPKAELAGMIRERDELEHRLELLESKVSLMAVETICGLKDDAQHVELYDGTLGVSVDFVHNFSPPVGQLQWLDDLGSRFSGTSESPGDVNDVRWGTGSLIGSDLFITAGHCFDRSGGGWIRPRRSGVTISEDEIATLMKVNFNFQINNVTKKLRDEDSYPVVRLLEFRRGNLDYAIVQLGQNAEGKVPGEEFGMLVVGGNDLTTEGAMLCVIQHPNGKPKQIEAGPLLSNRDGAISYDSIDTLGGSSGSSVLNGETGEIIGVHTNGGCAAFSGANFGVAIGAIRKFSSIL